MPDYRDALARAPRSGTKSSEAIDRFLSSFKQRVLGAGAFQRGRPPP
jgi:hypothetical protein